MFEGKIVVSGGFTDAILNTVEAYDHVADSWTHMPNMIETRFQHKSVAMKNKLFVIGGSYGTYGEVFDSTSNEFVLLKPLPARFLSHFWNLQYLDGVVLIGRKLVVFGERINFILYYDVEKAEWSDEPCEVTSLLQGYCCAKVPRL